MNAFPWGAPPGQQAQAPAQQQAPAEPAPGESQAEYDAKHAPAPAQVAAQQAVPPVQQAAAAVLGQPTQLPPQLQTTPAGALEQEAAPVVDRQVTHNEPILTTGASGEEVSRLAKLLAHAGFATNSVVKGENPQNVLDNSVMADVERFWAAYPDATEPDELYAGREGSIVELQGRWVGPHTWQKLYELAGAAVAPSQGA